MTEHADPDTSRPGPQTPNVRLPWALVVILSVAVLALTGLVSVRERELADLRSQGSAATATPTASATTDEQAAEVMRSLPRRQANDPRAMGAVDAPVVLVAWSDFRCPFCAHWARTTLPELAAYVESGSLRIEFRDLVLFGDQSRLAAIAARAAGQQGRYFEFSDALFAAAPASGHPTITKDDVIAFARQAGVGDLDRFTAALADTSIGAAVDEESTHAQSLGISGTPFFVVNTTPISGAQPLETFTATIESFGGHR